MENMDIYNKLRAVPQEAIKPIAAGRLKGMSDINPMWRIKALTETFGTCGFGWKYEITKQWLETGTDNEIRAFVNINLFVKVDGEWSEAIPGTGGSSLTTVERNGAYVSDEAYKMALTDALSVSCKALGMAADVYWANDRTKYTAAQQTRTAHQPPVGEISVSELDNMAQKPKEYKCAVCGKPFEAFTDKSGKTWNAGQVYHMAERANTDGVARCRNCSTAAGTKKNA